MKICISRCYTFSRSPIFNHNKSIKVADICSYVKNLSAKYQFPIGYEIQNTDENIISDIIIPQYKELNTPPYLSIGKEIKVNLEPGQFLVLPTRYLILLLLSKGKKLEIVNGKMVSMIDKSLLKTVDIDIALSAFYFESNDTFKKLTSLRDLKFKDKDGYDDYEETLLPFFCRQMGYLKRNETLALKNKGLDLVNDNYINPYDYKGIYEIIESEVIKLFGNYNNYVKCKDKQNITNINEYNELSFINYILKGKKYDKTK